MNADRLGVPGETAKSDLLEAAECSISSVEHLVAQRAAESRARTAETMRAQAAFRADRARVELQAVLDRSATSEMARLEAEAALAEAKEALSRAASDEVVLAGERDAARAEAVSAKERASWLEGDLASAQERTSSLERQLPEAQERIRSLEEELGSSRARTSSLEIELRDVQALAVVLERKVVQAEWQASEARRRASLSEMELSQALAVAQQMSSSTLWRAAAPLRRMGQAMPAGLRRIIRRSLRL